MTEERIRFVELIKEYQRRAGHNNGAGCLVCMTCRTLIDTIMFTPQESNKRIIDGVTITGSDVET